MPDPEVSPFINVKCDKRLPALKSPPPPYFWAALKHSHALHQQRMQASRILRFVTR